MEPRPLDPPELTDGVIVVRRMTEADLDHIEQSFADEPDLGAIMGFDEIPTRDKWREWLPIRDTGAWVAATYDGAYVGDLMVEQVKWNHARADLGIYTHHAHRGRGYGSRLVRLMTDWLFEQGFVRVQMLTHPDNERLQRMAARAGFERDALLRSYLVERGRRTDVVMFSRVAP